MFAIWAAAIPQPVNLLLKQTSLLIHTQVLPLQLQ